MNINYVTAETTWLLVRGGRVFRGRGCKCLWLYDIQLNEYGGSQVGSEKTEKAIIFFVFSHFTKNFDT